MNNFGLIFLLLCASVLATAQGVAAPMTVGTRAENIPENGTVTYTVVKTGQNDFSFLSPPGWKSELDAKAGTLTWISPDFRSMVRLRISDTDGEAVPKLKADELRQIIAKELENSRIIGELPCYTSGPAGLAFDSERDVEGKFRVNSRVAFIPVAGGLVQITLTTPAEEFRSRQMELSRFLNSFRVIKLKPA